MPELSFINDFINAHLSDLANYLVYAAIIIVTLIGFIKCLFPLWGTTHALRRATSILGRDTHDAGQVPRWQSEDFLGTRLEGCWKRFLQNARELDRRSLPCNVEDYINDDTVTHGPGNAGLAELIPSLLTSLGILGTFLGLTQGLTGLNMSDTKALMDGIPTLLDGMKFAFGTSVAGISCSLVFNMLNRISQGSSYRAIDEFIDTFTLLAMRRPLDADVQMMIQNQDSYNLIASPTDGLVPQLAGSIERAVGRAMSPVAQSMDSFLVGATRAQVEGVGIIVNSFVDQMNRSLNKQFMQLGQTMGEVSRDQQLTLQRVQDSITAADRIVADADKLHQVSGEVMNRFENYIRELSTARSRDERFEQQSGELLQKLQNASREQTDALLAIRSGQDQLRSVMADFQKVSAETMSAIRTGDAQAASRLDDAGEKLAAGYQRFTADAFSHLSRSLNTFEKNMEEVFTALGQKLNGQAVSQEDTAEMQRMLTSMERSMKETAATLRHFKEAEET